MGSAAASAVAVCAPQTGPCVRRGRRTLHARRARSPLPEWRTSEDSGAREISRWNGVLQRTGQWLARAEGHHHAAPGTQRDERVGLHAEAGLKAELIVAMEEDRQFTAQLNSII